MGNLKIGQRVQIYDDEGPCSVGRIEKLGRSKDGKNEVFALVKTDYGYWEGRTKNLSTLNKKKYD